MNNSIRTRASRFILASMSVAFLMFASGCGIAEHLPLIGMEARVP